MGQLFNNQWLFITWLTARCFCYRWSLVTLLVLSKYLYLWPSSSQSFQLMFSIFCHSFSLQAMWCSQNKSNKSFQHVHFRLFALYLMGWPDVNIYPSISCLFSPSSCVSILGMHLFGCKFGSERDGDTLPDRKNFDSLLWAIVTVFQVSINPFLPFPYPVKYSHLAVL